MFGWFKKKPPRPNGPDFSAIDSQAKAIELFERLLPEDGNAAETKAPRAPASKPGAHKDAGS